MRFAKIKKQPPNKKEDTTKPALSRDYQRLLLTMKLAPIIGIFHHIDHVARGDSGWPFMPLVTPFTLSLLVYPLIAYGFYRESRNPGKQVKYWLGFNIFGAILALPIHLLPMGADRLWDYPATYNHSIWGWLASLALVLLIGNLLYSIYLCSKILTKKNVSKDSSLNSPLSPQSN